METKSHTIESLIASGYISETFGARLAKDKEEGVITGAIVETAISATLLANQEAKKTNQPVLIADLTHNNQHKLPKYHLVI